MAERGDDERGKGFLEVQYMEGKAVRVSNEPRGPGMSGAADGP